jgi:hypothetical protein
MSKIAIHFYDNVDCTGDPKIVNTKLTLDGKLPVASLKEEFDVKTLKEIDDGKAFLIGADEHGDSRLSFAGKTTIKVTGELKATNSGAADRIWWNATVSIQASLNTKGARRTVYRIAFQHNAFFTGESTSIFYDGDTLKVNLAFEEKRDALAFETDLIGATETHRSALEGLVVDLTVEQRRGTFPLEPPRRIMPSDYKPEESTSPDDGISVAASTVTVLDFKSDFVRYQRIESIELLQHALNGTEKCHLIDKAHCEKFSSYKQYQNDENNALSMSRDFHGWFDGLIGDVPMFKLDYIRHSNQPMANMDNRYEVVISVTVIDAAASKFIFPRLSSGSAAVEGQNLSMLAKVYVRNPSVFKYCLEWKAKRTSNKWREYLAETNRD